MIYPLNFQNPINLIAIFKTALISQYFEMLFLDLYDLLLAFNSLFPLLIDLSLLRLFLLLLEFINKICARFEVIMWLPSIK